MEKEFYEGKRSNRIPFVINDSVEISDGPAKGKLAAVISIEPGDDGVSYLVEPGDGSGDLIIPAEQLTLK
ncbi:hypothetical protein ACJO5Y_02935 [Marinobacter sp. GN3S48]|uniref:hypothetical protein n=1 Tax=Marinobacter sp. GN3S48 TaxID=3382302 RepID=UPI00387AA813